ncbi:MAG: hypothetical protein OEW39_15595 [Deltaproteobacteria bacterium]|nr:hypothetical protein [Deltaproteobacteria bacterium]
MGLFRILFFISAAVVAYLIFNRLTSRPGTKEAAVGEDARLGQLVQDPHCKVYVDSSEAVRRKVPNGLLFFCSEKCAHAYLEDQGKKGA